MTSHLFSSALPSGVTGPLPPSGSSFPLSMFLNTQPIPSPQCTGPSCAVAVGDSEPHMGSSCALSLPWGITQLLSAFPAVDFPQHVSKSIVFETAEFKPTGQFLSGVAVSTWDVWMDITSTPQLSESPFLRHCISKGYYGY